MYILYTCIYLVDLTKAVSTKGFTCVITEHNSLSFAGSLWLVSMRCCLLWRELRRFRTMWGSRRLSRCWMRTGMGGSNLSMPWRWGFKILFYILENKKKIVQCNSIYPAKFTMATGVKSKKYLVFMSLYLFVLLWLKFCFFNNLIQISIFIALICKGLHTLRTLTDFIWLHLILTQLQIISW